MTKDLSYYLSLPYRLEIIPDTEEGGYVALYPDLPGCLTCSDTLEQAIANAQQAKNEWFVAALEDGVDIKEPDNDIYSEKYTGEFYLKIPKSLHRSLAEHSVKEGISINQYCLYLLTKNDILRQNV